MNTSYIEAADQHGQSWPRYVLGTLFILFFWFGLGSVATVALWRFWGLSQDSLSGPSLSQALQDFPPVQGYLLINVSFLLFLAGTLLAVKLVHGRSPLTLVTGRSRISWSRILLGFGLWFLMAAAVSLVEFVLEPDAFSFSLNLRAFLPFILLALIVTPIQTTAEELFFRGYLVQWGSMISKNRIFLSLLSGLLFMLPHLANPEVQASFALAMLNFFVLGSFLTWISLKDGTLELALGIHAANNLFAGLVVNYAESALPAPSIFLAARLDPVYNLASALVMMVLFYLLVFIIPKHKRH